MSSSCVLSMVLYVYSRTKVSKSNFEDPAFRELINAVWQMAGGSGEAPVLCRKDLMPWVTGEYMLFVFYLNFMLQLMLEHSKGNAFAQGMHDCTTTENKRKHMAMGLELVDPNLDQNHAVCIAFTPIPDGYDETGYKHIDQTLIELTNGKFTYNQVCHSTISDRGAKGIATRFDHEQDICQMHDADKIGRSAVGILTRSKAKVSTA
jgi:hypothetical protein